MSIMDHGFEPLPPYADPREALRQALPALRPAEEITVTAAAEKYMRVNVAGQWLPFRRDVTPYMVEPTDMIASREYRSLAFCGPSQSGKTQMLQSASAYAIAANPGRVALFQMTRDSAALFEREKLAPMINNSPALRDRVAKGRGSDTIFQKLFVGGTHLTLDWPTVTKLSSATIRLVLGTDYDHFPKSIGGEGDAHSMMRARTRTFMSRGMVVVESSPGAPLTDENWRPETPHAAPPVEYGVLALYPQGTRGRWYWSCPHCADEFEPTFARLDYPKGLDPAEAAAKARMQCPHCGALIGHEHKAALNAAGRWLHESSELDPETGQPLLVPIDSGRVRRTDMLSYWLDGAAAAFSTWSELVEQYENAIRAFEATGDEEKLKTAMNTGQAQPYKPRSANDAVMLTLQGLKDKAQGNTTPKGIAPDWTRYITVQVDVQSTRFPVGVVAWGKDGRHALIDRFDLFTPPGEDDRALRPFEVAGDWAVLEALSTRSWPVLGTGGEMRALAIAVDMHGGGSTTENAYRFYRGRRNAGEGHLWFLTRGEGGLTGQKATDRVWLKAPERVSQGAKRRRAAKDIEILHMATDRLKDAVSASLHNTEGGVNLCELAEWIPDDVLIELTAEIRGLGGWEKRAGMVRNEALDHLVQARALHIIKGCERINWDVAPYWAIWGEKNPHVILPKASSRSEAEPVERPDPPSGRRVDPIRSAPGRGGWIPNRSKWL
ncbi:phage terminase large subunit family protein [Pseudomonas sp. GX19020]|uniref:phage terminase large subunit family protein n=1 Tax=Pseudomonas sp. GX19020 TaxID=2942277 RepID=UPI0020196A27|nr:terminase gpA endonuclease subunit [Pseudomonas sp. GX19020]MCL4069010.1 phage terminase large subunit family protein [Pseudomonas sp. GX19020]